VVMRGRHPDDDVLADLAADVLPVAEARAVEAHVMECEHCSRLLSDAERIRGLLLSGDPGPMPADVWARIEAALAAAGPAADARPAPVSAGPAPAVPLFPLTQTGPPPDRADPPDAVPAAAARSSWQDDADPLDAPDRWGSARASSARAGAAATGSLRRLSTTRRDAREGVRRGPRWGLAAVGMAAAVLVAAVTVGTLRLTSGGGSSTGAGTAAFGQSSGEGSAAAGAGGADASAVRYERTGTRYTTAGLANQARALVLAAAPAAPAPQAAPVPSTSRGAAASAARVPRVAVAPDPTATDVSNPAGLAGCLTALNARPDRVVAVDLATYDEREAAVIVLTANGGGYEVFVVERTCSAADDHTLAYQEVKG
jgi:hypothetical protein